MVFPAKQGADKKLKESEKSTEEISSWVYKERQFKSMRSFKRVRLGLIYRSAWSRG